MIMDYQLNPIQKLIQQQTWFWRVETLGYYWAGACDLAPLQKQYPVIVMLYHIP